MIEVCPINLLFTPNVSLFVNFHIEEVLSCHKTVLADLYAEAEAVDEVSSVVAV